MRRHSRGSVWPKYTAVSNQGFATPSTNSPADIADSSPTNPLLVALVRSKLVPWSLWSHQHGSGCSANRGRAVWFCLAMQTLVALLHRLVLPCLANNLGRTIWFCPAPITKRRSNHRLPVSSYHPPALPATSYQLYQVFWN